MTHRKILEFWTETKRVIVAPDGEPYVKQTNCCCKAPGATRRTCATAQGNKNPCRCYCHDARK